MKAKLLSLSLSVSLLLGVIAISSMVKGKEVMACNPSEDSVKIATEEECTTINNETFYVICDVVDWSETDDGTEICVEMQDGSLEVYVAYDTPDEIELVCLTTENLDDFSAYRIVALR